MAAKVSLSVTEGSATGKKFEFSEHDTFLFGRMPDCHATFPNDTRVSRHHFILEVCPPKLSLRDLGSLNGTFVNETKCGAREKGETPKQGAARKYPTVDLANGDAIRVGRTTIAVSIEEDLDPQISAGIEPGAFSEMSPEDLFAFVFGGPDRPALLKVPGYSVEAEIGRGGFGAIYRARRKGDSALVAIKVMLSQAEAPEAAILAFKREVEVNRQLQHPNIVEFVDSGSHQGAFFFVMQLCDGGSLLDLARKNGAPLTPEQLLPIAREALTGLAHAHKKGFVHRDLKPGNVLLHRGRALISDFGLSKSFQKAGLSGISVTGKSAGTPVFMPPEQVINFKYVKPVSDVFSMGATFYTMLTGAYPFAFSPKRDPFDVILNDDVVPIRTRRRDIPKALATAIDRAVSKKQKDRFPDAEAFLGAF
jgi:hypothetical protein